MKRNIVLLILDSVRKDYFDTHAPRLAALSDVSFEQCRAASSCSVPSHGTILTGALPAESGIHTRNVDYAVPTSETFLDRFQGYHTIGVSANEYVGPEFGFDSHFDSWTNISPYHRFEAGLDIKHFSSAGPGADVDGPAFYLRFLETALRHDAPVQSLLNGAAGQLDQWLARAPVPKLLDDGARPVSRTILKHVRETDEPFFLLANYMDAHYPMHHVLGYDRTLHSAPNDWTSFGFEGYQELTFGLDDAVDRHETFVTRYRELYAATIDYLDRQVADTVESILATTDRETTIIITSDHGENLGFAADDRQFWHNASLTEALLHVPLTIINPPEGFQAEEDEPFSHRHLGTLMAELAEGNTPDLFETAVPAEIVGGVTAGAGSLLSEADHEWFGRAQRAVIRTDRKTLWDSLGNVTAYELDPERPCWQRELDEAEAGAVLPDESFWSTDIASYRRSVDTGAVGGDREISVATEERLRELGYL